MTKTFQNKPTAPDTQKTDPDDTLTTKSYVDEKAQEGGGIPAGALKPYAKKHEVVRLLNGYQKYVCEPDKWVQTMTIDLTTLGMGEISVSDFVMTMLEVDESPIDEVWLYEGDADYVVIPELEPIGTVGTAPFFGSEADLVSYIAFIMTDGQQGALPHIRDGVAGRLPSNSLLTANVSLLLPFADKTTVELRYAEVGHITNFSDMFYNSAVTELDLSAWDVSSGTNFGYMFSNSAVTELDLSTWDVSSGTNFDGMFMSSAVTELDLSAWDVSSGTNFRSMFNNSAVTELDLSTWDVSSGTNFGYMFMSSAVTELDLSAWDVSSGTNFDGMFYNSAVTELDLSAWDVSSGADFDDMFYNSAVTELDLSGWVLPSGAPKSSMLSTASLQNLYCKDETEADKLTTGTNIRTGVKVWVGKRGAPGTYLYETT